MKSRTLVYIILTLCASQVRFKAAFRVDSNLDYDFEIRDVHDDVVITMRKGAGSDVTCPPKCHCFDDGMVNCSRLGLVEVPKLPSNVTKLDLSLNNIDVIADGAFSGLTQLTLIDLGNNHLTDDSIKEKSFEGTTQLQTMYLDENAFTRMPNYLPKEVTSLNFYGCQIKNFSSPYLSRYKELRSLAFSQNQITHLPCDIGKLFPNLTELDVSFNKITDHGIYTTTFQGTSQMQTVSFRFNKLTKIPSNLPSTLQHFDMVGNPFTVVPPNAFINQSQLDTIELWDSGLRTIEDFAFAGLTQLTILDVMECHVTSPITNSTFHGLESVKTIDISLSNITIMEAGALNGLTKLESLWLNDNPFKTLNALLFDHKTIPSISEIYLWGNNWVCDCKLKWLKEMQENSSVIQDPHLMICAEPPELSGKAWDTISAERFVC